MVRLRHKGPQEGQNGEMQAQKVGETIGHLIAVADRLESVTQRLEEALDRQQQEQGE